MEDYHWRQEIRPNQQEEERTYFEHTCVILSWKIGSRHVMWGLILLVFVGAGR